MKRYGVAVALVAIVLLAGALRLYHIGLVPTELDADELDLYNSAYSIATTGHDLDGSLLPFLYSSETRNPPMYAIAAYAGVAMFGRTPLGIRFGAAAFGTIAVLLLFGIAYELTRRRDIALMSALLMATQPIFVHFARVGWEPASELPFLLAGIYVALRALRSPRVSLRLTLLAAMLFGLTAYTYDAGWFYALVLGGALLLVNIRRFFSRRGALVIASACAVWIAVAAPALWMWFFDAHTISHTTNMSTFANGLTPDALHTFFVNYAAHFQWTYLVTTGDPVPALTWRYLNGMGAFFGWVVVLAGLGLLASYRYVRPRSALVWTWWWLVAYPLGGALTNQGTPGTPNAPRTLAGAPVVCILTAIGVALVVDLVSSPRRPKAARVAGTLAHVAFVVAVLYSTATFAQFYFNDYVHRNSNAWFSGTRELFGDIVRNRNGYQRVCFNVRAAWYQLPSFTRFYLHGVPLQVVENVDDPRCSLSGTLAAVDDDHPLGRADFEVLDTIKDVDGNAFATLSGKP
jgi:4-amino-4-deoxy-L-arabinose transferase-like glycosyltransferase